MPHRIPSLAIIALVVSAAAACNGSSPNSESTKTTASTLVSQTLHGTVSLHAYALDNPVVIARRADGRTFFGAIHRDGTFSVTVPVGSSYRISLANTTKSGYAAVSHVKWPGTKATWAKLDASLATLNLGTILPATAGVGVRPADGTGEISGSSGKGSSGGGSNDNQGGAAGAQAADDHGVEASAGGAAAGDDKEVDVKDKNDGETEVRSCGAPSQGKVDLVCNIGLALGSTFKLADAFLAKGAAPSAIVDVTMNGGSWRLAELRSGASFTVEQSDCDHEGNRSRGRDRLSITWRNADGSTGSDHLDLRYCDASGGAVKVGSDAVSGDSSDDFRKSDDRGLEPNDCEGKNVPVCAAATQVESRCDGGDDSSVEDDDANDDKGAGGSEASDDKGAGGSEAGDDKGARVKSGRAADAVCATPPAGGTTPPAGGTTPPAGGTTPPAGGTTPTSPPAGGTTPPSNGGVTPPSTGTAPPGANGDPCVVTADCGAPLTCIASVCTTLAPIH